jgi:hypothetical protein
MIHMPSGIAAWRDGDAARPETNPPPNYGMPRLMERDDVIGKALSLRGHRST